MVRRTFEWSIKVHRSRERPRNRWRDSVLKDIRILVVKNWTKMAVDKPARLDLLEKLKTHKGLQDERRSYIYIYTHIHIYMYMYISIYVCISLSLSLYIYIYIDTHTYICSSGQPWAPIEQATSLIVHNSVCCINA